MHARVSKASFSSIAWGGRSTPVAGPAFIVGQENHGGGEGFGVALAVSGGDTRGRQFAANDQGGDIVGAETSPDSPIGPQRLALAPGAGGLDVDARLLGLHFAA